MIKKEEKTVYHFSTQSKTIAHVIDLVAHDQKCRELVLLFARIEGRKRCNTLLRIASHLANNSQRH